MSPEEKEFVFPTRGGKNAGGVPTLARNPMWKDSCRQRQRRARSLPIEVRFPTRETRDGREMSGGVQDVGALDVSVEHRRLQRVEIRDPFCRLV